VKLPFIRLGRRWQNNAETTLRKADCRDWTGSRIWPIVGYGIIGVETSGSTAWEQRHPTEKIQVFLDVRLCHLVACNVIVQNTGCHSPNDIALHRRTPHSSGTLLTEWQVSHCLHICTDNRDHWECTLLNRLHMTTYKTITNLSNKFDAFHISVERCFPHTQFYRQGHRIGERVFVQFRKALTAKNNKAILKVTLFSEKQSFTLLVKTS
jgi:hypothetical protein